MKTILSILFCSIFSLLMSQNSSIYLQAAGGFSLVEGDNGSAVNMIIGYRPHKTGFGIGYTKYSTNFQSNPQPYTHYTFDDYGVSLGEGFYHSNSTVTQDVLSLIFSFDLLHKSKYIIKADVGLSYFWHTEIDVRLNGLNSIQTASYFSKPASDSGWNIAFSGLYKIRDQFLVGPKLILENIIDYNVGFLFCTEMRL